MRSNSIKFRIPMYMSIFALFCVIITGLIFQVFFRYKLEADIENKNMIISQMISAELDLYIRNARDTVVTAANFSSQSSGDLDKIEDEIFRMYDNFNYFDLIFFMSDDAKMVFSKPPNDVVQGRSYTDRDYYWDIVKNGKESTISSLLVSSVLNEPHFIIAAPVKDNKGHIIGLIGAGVPLVNIESILKDTVKDFDGKIWIVDKARSIVLHPDVVMTDRLVSVEELGLNFFSENLTLDQIYGDQINRNEQYIAMQGEQYGAFSFGNETGWLVVVEQNRQVINNEINQYLKQLFLVELVVLVLATLLGFFIARWITKPIDHLVKIVRKLPMAIQTGEPIDQIINTKNSDEVAELSEAFVDMGYKLQENIQELEHTLKRENEIKQYLNNILRSVVSGIIVANAADTVTIVNNQALSITGYGSVGETPKNIFRLLESVKVEIEVDKENFSSLFANDEIHETTLIDKTGCEVMINYTCSPVNDLNGQYLGFIFQFRDITQLKKIENELRRDDRIHTMGELSASIIHDIGNPLAGMSNLIEVLRDEEIDDLSKTQVLDVLNEEVNDLNVLVINFLDFVKSGSSNREYVQLEELLKSVFKLYRRELKSKNIAWDISIGNMSSRIHVNSTSIKQVLINILKNAIEAIGHSGNIHCSIYDEGNTIILEVKDTGCGMGDETLDKLFNPFYTTKSDGTGLGLSIAYTTLKEHDGRIDVESEIDQGTLFKLTFQKC